MTTNSQGKRKGPNGMYWANVLLSNGKGKCVMAECINEKDKLFRIWTNSRKTAKQKLILEAESSKREVIWATSIEKLGWYFIELPESFITFYDF